MHLYSRFSRVITKNCIGKVGASKKDPWNTTLFFVRTSLILKIKTLNAGEFHWGGDLLKSNGGGRR
jgi:hypothetical protein